MAIKVLKLLVCLVTICVLCSVVNGESVRRVIKQLNSLRTDLSFVSTDISTLFEKVYAINKTLSSKTLEIPLHKNKDRDKEIIGRVIPGITKGAFNSEIVRLVKAFAMEKLQNRQLQKRLGTLEKNQNVIEKIYESEKDTQARLNGLEKRQSDTFDRLDLEKQKIQALSSRLEDLEQNNIDMTRDLDAEKRRNQALQTVIEDLQHKTKVIKEALDDEKFLNQGLQTGLEDLEQSVNNTVWSCRDAPESGVYNIKFDSLGLTKSVYCDTDTDGGGWIVTLRRQDGSEDFDRTWDEYKNGFGDPDGEFWIGNDILHELTKPEPKELRIDMKPWFKKKVFAKYEQFSVDSGVNNYTLTISGFSGTAGNGLDWHNGMKFTTKDVDNDLFGKNCARNGDGGWWHKYCYVANLNDKYEHDTDQGIYWTGTGHLQAVDMKLR